MAPRNNSRSSSSSNNNQTQPCDEVGLDIRPEQSSPFLCLAVRIITKGPSASELPSLQKRKSYFITRGYITIYLSTCL